MIIEDQTFGYIHCKCSPNIKASPLSETMAYMVWSWIHNKDKRGHCKKCGRLLDYYDCDEIPQNLKPIFVK